jgi:hypothetical protein
MHRWFSFVFFGCEGYIERGKEDNNILYSDSFGSTPLLWPSCPPQLQKKHGEKEIISEVIVRAYVR